MPGQSRKIYGAAVYRSVIDLEVAGVNHQTSRGFNSDAHGIGNAVAYPEPSCPKVVTKLVTDSRFDGFHDRAPGGTSIVQLNRDQSMGQSRGVYRHIYLRQYKGKGSDVILMSVGDQDRLDPIGPLHKIGNVGDNQIDPRHIVVRKLDPAVDNDDVVAALQGHHVLTDLPQSAQGNDSQRWHHVIQYVYSNRLSCCAAGGSGAGAGTGVAEEFRISSKTPGMALKSSMIPGLTSWRYKAAAGCITG